MVPPPAGAAGAKGEVRVQDPDRSQRTVARRSAEARATVPDVELGAEVQPAASLALAGGLRCGITAVLVRACALALRDVPRANGSYRDGRVELYSRVNIGVTVATEDTYAIPTVFDADHKSPAELGEEISGVVERARVGQLSPPQLAGATFTLFDAGALGVASATAMIIPPQAAALAAGTVREVPVIRGGDIVPGHTMTLTLACDHRILYGAHAAALLVAITSRLEQASL